MKSSRLSASKLGPNLARIGLPFLLISSLHTSACAANVNLGYVSFDITNPPLAEFDIQNLTGPNSSADPDTSFPVTTSVSFTNLNLRVNFLTGPSQTFGKSYFTLGADGLSYNGADSFNEDPVVGDPVTSATLSGTFGTTALSLNDDTTISVSSDFSTTVLPSTGSTLLDSDFAVIAAVPSSGAPEPGTYVLLSGGLAVLFIARNKYLTGIKQVLGTASSRKLLTIISLLRNTRTTGSVSSAPPEEIASSSTVWRRASAPCALLSNYRATHWAAAWQGQRSYFAVLTKRSLAAGLAITSALSTALGATNPVKLTQATTPSTGVAGSTSVSVTGSGFPAGVTVSNVTVNLETSCGVTAGETPAIALQVRNIIGSTDKIEFQLPASLKTATYYVTLAGTAGSISFASSNCALVEVTNSSTTLSACNPGSSMGLLVPAAGSGTTPVAAYVPNANWGSGVKGVQLVPIEGPGAPASIATADYVNSCSTDSSSGITACTANDFPAHVYLITGATVTHTVTTASNSTADFSGGSCYNCGIAVNSVTHQAAITMGYAGAAAALQFLDLASGTLGSPIATTHPVSEDIVWDPFRNLILSPNEGDAYDLYQITGSSLPEPSTVTLFTRSQSAGPDLDSAAEDCTTGIALSTSEGTGNLYIADLKQSTFTAGSPGTWSAPAQAQYFPEFTGLSAGTSAIAIAQGSTHQGVVAGEFGGNSVGVIQLPATSGPGVGTPSVVDYAYATLPPTPDGYDFANGYDPHTTTAYTSPNNGKAYAVAASWPTGTPTYLAIIDIQAMLSASRTPGTHTVSPSVDLLASGIVKYIATH